MYNDDSKNIVDIYGFIGHNVNDIIISDYKIKFKYTLPGRFQNLIKTAYLGEGGIEIKTNKLTLTDKKTCGDDKEFFTQDDFNQIELGNLISFELENKIFCLNRDELIGFWNQEPDEKTGFSGAFNFGDCKYDENNRPYEDTCKKFYKIPIPQLYITRKTKNEIEQNPNINYWKLEKEKIVKMGR